ncbi:MAG TPA: 2-hydroxyacid dehydrogenase [Candidatus Saccharimonadales bacterium]|nr:2-hydroxyacid dehydrogenase [Candidatus Saccharimonadales bacterium]
MKIVFPDRIDLDETSRQKFQEMGVTMYDDTPSDEAVIIERIKDAEIITANFIDITRKAIDAAPNLKYIISPAVGYDWIDAKYAASKGIKVLNCPTQNAEAVAEHALTLMLAVAHRITEADLSLQQGQWQQQQLVGVELSHKKLGLVGYGKVGKLIEQKVAGLNMEVNHVNSNSSDGDLDTLLQESDVVCLCLPLNDATRNIIDERRLKLLKKSTIFVNVARGGLVDQAALLEQLKTGGIRGAGLDVFLDEPFTGGAPDSITEIAKLPNVVATPHMAYNTEETMQRLGQELLADVESCVNGSPMNVVNGGS